MNEGEAMEKALVDLRAAGRENIALVIEEAGDTFNALYTWWGMRCTRNGVPIDEFGLHDLCLEIVSISRIPKAARK